MSFWNSPNRSINRMDGSRLVYGNERTCANCTHMNSCWSGFVPSNPVNWQLRASWQPDSYIPYLRTIFGGLCMHFNHPNSETNESLRAAEQKRINELGAREQPEWELT